MSRRRPAYTLIEVTVVSTMLSLLAVVTAVTLHGLYSGSRHLRGETARQRIAADLALRLRRDVHQAREVRLREQPDEGPTALIVLLADGLAQVEYLGGEDGVRRVVRRGGSVVHRDRFRLGMKSVAVGWQVLDDPPRRVVLEVGSDEGLSGASGPEAGSSSGRLKPGALALSAPERMRVEAVIGLLVGTATATPEANP